MVVWGYALVFLMLVVGVTCALVQQRRSGRVRDEFAVLVRGKPEPWWRRVAGNSPDWAVRFMVDDCAAWLGCCPHVTNGNERTAPAYAKLRYEIPGAKFPPCRLTSVRGTGLMQRVLDRDLTGHWQDVTIPDAKRFHQVYLLRATSVSAVFVLLTPGLQQSLLRYDAWARSLRPDLTLSLIFEHDEFTATLRGYDAPSAAELLAIHKTTHALAREIAAVSSNMWPLAGRKAQ